MNPTLATDFYKQGHISQYPKNTSLVFSNLTARGSYMKNIDRVIWTGLQRWVQKFADEFQRNFFDRPKAEAVAEHTRIMNSCLGPGAVSSDHLEQLHDLGYLPLKFLSLPEGSRVDLRVPMCVFWNTLPEFFWLTNFIETDMSSEVWGAITSATTADQYRQIFDKWAKKTNPEGAEFAEWQGHDFSYRGMFGREAAEISGMGHLLSFAGTDTIPAIIGMEKYYDADVEKELVGGSVAATEHSCSSANICGDYSDEFYDSLNQEFQDGIIRNQQSA